MRRGTIARWNLFLFYSRSVRSWSRERPGRRTRRARGAVLARAFDRRRERDPGNWFRDKRNYVNFDGRTRVLTLHLPAGSNKSFCSLDRGSRKRTNRGPPPCPPPPPLPGLTFYSFDFFFQPREGGEACVNGVSTYSWPEVQIERQRRTAEKRDKFLGHCASRNRNSVNVSRSKFLDIVSDAKPTTSHVSLLPAQDRSRGEDRSWNRL